MKKLLTRKNILAGVFLLVVVAGYFLLFSEQSYNQEKAVQTSVQDQAPLTDTEKFNKAIQAALSDPQLASLATIYAEECYDQSGPLLGNRFSSFNEVVLSAVNVADTPSGKIKLIPCTETDFTFVTFSTDLIILDDGKGYEALPTIRIGRDPENRARMSDYKVSDFRYDAENNLYIEHAPYRPSTIDDCWAEGTYKFIEQEFVLQTYREKAECDNRTGEGVILYDINQQ